MIGLLVVSVLVVQPTPPVEGKPDGVVVTVRVYEPGVGPFVGERSVQKWCEADYGDLMEKGFCFSKSTKTPLTDGSQYRLDVYYAPVMGKRALDLGVVPCLQDCFLEVTTDGKDRVRSVREVNLPRTVVPVPDVGWNVSEFRALAYADFLQRKKYTIPTEEILSLILCAHQSLDLKYVFVVDSGRAACVYGWVTVRNFIAGNFYPVSRMREHQQAEYFFSLVESPPRVDRVILQPIDLKRSSPVR